MKNNSDNKKCLLLNKNYFPINFISYKKVFKMLVNNKIEIIDNWIDFKFKFGNIIIEMPSTVRLLNQINNNFIKYDKFSKKAVFKRDQYLCCYCLKALTNVDLSIDHILPLSKGGCNSFLNCVTCCKFCNSFKRDRTPEEAGMKIKQLPFIPKLSIKTDYEDLNIKHESWINYV